jgi:hypothetical protein
MLWSNDEIRIPKGILLGAIQRFILYVTYTGKTACVCHSFDLEDMDNPALVALVRYKWYVPICLSSFACSANPSNDSLFNGICFYSRMTIGFRYWFLKTLFYGYIATFFLVGVFLDIYDFYGDSYDWEAVHMINVILSCIFALNGLRDILVLTAVLKMKPRG